MDKEKKVQKEEEEELQMSLMTVAASNHKNQAPRRLPYTVW